MPEPQALHRNALARSGHNSRSKFPTTCSRSAPPTGTQPRTPPRRAQSNSHQLIAQPAPPSPSHRMQRGTLGSARISRAGGTRVPPPQAGPTPPGARVRGEAPPAGPDPLPPPARCPLTTVQTPAGPRGSPVPPPLPAPGALRPGPPRPYPAWHTAAGTQRGRPAPGARLIPRPGAGPPRRGWQQLRVGPKPIGPDGGHSAGGGGKGGGGGSAGVPPAAFAPREGLGARPSAKRCAAKRSDGRLGRHRLWRRAGYGHLRLGFGCSQTALFCLSRALL